MLGTLPSLMDYIKAEINVDDVFQLPSNPLSTDMTTIFSAFKYYLKIAEFMSPLFPETFR